MKKVLRGKSLVNVPSISRNIAQKHAWYSYTSQNKTSQCLLLSSPVQTYYFGFSTSSLDLDSPLI